MADTDPFGRREGEDPLGAMGWSTEGTLAPDSGPADVAAPEQPDRAVRRRLRRLPDAPVGMPGMRRRSNRGCASAVVVLGLLAVAVAGGIGSLVDDVDTPGTERDEPLPRPAEPIAPDGQDSPPRAPRGLERTSMLRRGNLAPALRRLRAITRSDRVDLVRVDAEQVLVTVELGGGGTRLAQARWDGEPEVLSTSPSGGGGSSFAWSDVDPSAPARIVREATRGRASRSLAYLVLIDAAGLRWSAFLKGGGTFSASPDGREVNRIGG